MSIFGEAHEAEYKKYLGYIFIILCTGFFLSHFVFSWKNNWEEKFSIFGVHAFNYPGADSRNIQVSAYCHKKGFPIYQDNICLEQAEIVKSIYPKAEVTILNYPSIWVKVYESFGDSSEAFFRNFWQINALVFILTVVMLCWQRNAMIFPAILFSPVSLLAIERGNTDAAIFFMVFLPLMMFKNKVAQGFSLGLAASLKVFPLFAFPSILGTKRPVLSFAYLLGILIVSPLLVNSMLEITQVFSATIKGFAVAYGLFSILNAPWLSDHQAVAWVFLVTILAVIGYSAYLILRNEKSLIEIKELLELQSELERKLMIASMAIFVLTYLFFVNWAYRLIFVIPALVMLSQNKSLFCRVSIVNLVVILWMPLVPAGWYVQNILCNLLCIPFVAVLLVHFGMVSKQIRLALKGTY